MRGVKKWVGGLLLAAVLSGSGATAQGTEAVRSTELTAAQIEAAVESIASQIRQLYLFEDRGEAMAAHVEARAAAGDYRGLNATAFQTAVTADMQESSHDRHMYLTWDPEAFSAATSGGGQGGQAGFGPGPAGLAQRRAADANGGIAEVRWMPERVGYLRISQWYNLQFSRAPLVAALEALAGARAIIFDVRANGGGDAGMVAFLQAYFMEHGKPLLNFTNRSQGSAFPRSVATQIEGEPFAADLPVWVLADGGSGSASEDFAFTIKHDGRGRVVGEATAGAAHMNTIRPVAPGFMLSISWAGPISPVTGGNWEGTGVIPDLEVPAPLALEAALAEVYAGMAAEASDAADRTRLESRAEANRATVRAGSAISGRFGDLPGVYGNQEVSAAGKYLRVGRIDGPPRDYRQVGDDRFVALLDDVEVRFHREGGRVVALQIDRGGAPGDRLERASGME